MDFIGVSKALDRQGGGFSFLSFGDNLPSQLEIRRLLSLIFYLLFPPFFSDEGLPRNRGRGIQKAGNIHPTYRRKIIKEIRRILIAQTTLATGYVRAKNGREREDVETTVLGMSTDRSFHRDISDACDAIISELPSIRLSLLRDATAIFDGDPAAGSVAEVILAYPGFRAIMIYRISHCLFLRGIPIIPRLMTEHAHRETGIDIHPGAKIGEYFSIDHGTGVVIGETAEIGQRVRIYQGVTLGAKSINSRDGGSLSKNQKRHPTIGNGCIIYAGATILGGDTVIGDGSVIGGNVWLTKSTPPGSRVYYSGG